jgi:two-component sensor histidine kinase
VAHTWRKLRANTPRHLLVVSGLCLGIALLLTAIDGRGFGAKLVYSLCIGLVCTLVVDCARVTMAWWSDRTRRARGLPLLDTFSGWHGAIPGTLLAVVLGPTVGMTLGDAITGYKSASLLQLDSATTRITLVLSLLGTLISLVVLSSMERLASAREQAEASQRLAAETQLRLLQSQLEPHMLFNTLANLRVLIGLQPQQAQEMLDHLIAYLRATLSASRSQTHSLATEFERVADYLALMAVRMGPRLQVQLDLPDALRQVAVPPLLLQPLVENAIKHGLEPQVAGGLVRVQARQRGGELVLVVHDTGRGLQPQRPDAPGSHFGLSQVRQRLATLYGAAASLRLQDAAVNPEQPAGTPATGVVVTVVMPMPSIVPEPVTESPVQQSPP